MASGDVAGVILPGICVGYALKSIGDFADAGRKQMKDAARPFFSRLEQDAKVLKDYEEAYG